MIGEFCNLKKMMAGMAEVSFGSSGTFLEASITKFAKITQLQESLYEFIAQGQ